MRSIDKFVSIAHYHNSLLPDPQMNQHFYRLLPLLLIIFIDSFSYFVVIPVLLQLFYDNQYGLLPLDATEVMRNIATGAALSLSMLSALLAAPFIGSASDKYGRKNILLVCLGLIFLGFLLPIMGIIQKNIYLIFIGRCLAGVGSMSQPVAQAAVADLCEDKEKSLYLSLIAVAMTLALIVSPLAGGFLSDSKLVSWFNVTTPFWFAIALSIISALLLVFFFKETIPSHMRAEMLSLIAAITGIKTAITDYHIGALLLLFFCLELGWSQYYQSIFLYLNQVFHYSPQYISLFNVHMGVFMAVSLLCLYPLLLRYFSIFRIMRHSIILVLIGLLGCALFPIPIMQWIFTPLIAVFTGCAYVSLVTLISDRMPLSQQGQVMGYLSTLLFSAWMLTGISSGWLISIFSTLPLYFALIALGLAGVTLVLHRSKRGIVNRP
jgi:DHA1 family tetracycline resistance protein-like MFS transporter